MELNKITPSKRKLAEQYLDFAYELALSSEHASYPAYYDGVKRKENFVETVMQAFERENEGIFLVEEKGEVIGWIHYYCLAEERYLGVKTFLIAWDADKALGEFVVFCEREYPDCDIWIGVPASNQAVVRALKARGFSLLESSRHNMLFLEDYAPREVSPSVTRISRVNYELFREIHRQWDEEMYWNCDRIYEDLEHWAVWIYRENGGVRGAIYCTDEGVMAEIFGVDFPDGDICIPVYRELLTACVNHVKESGQRNLCFFTDEAERFIVAEYGFRFIGEYQCWKKDAYSGEGQ